MIRINLVGGDRQKTKKAAIFDIGKQNTLACSLMLVLAALGIGWGEWVINQGFDRVV